MKLGVAYIVFDGTELLEHSIKQIKSQVDYVCVIYQSRSWFGHPISSEDSKNLEYLKKSGLVDDVFEYSNFRPLSGATPNNIKSAKNYLRQKRQFGLTQCLLKGCTHYLCMDNDEFYETSEFKQAKREIEINGYDVTAVRFINYVNIPTVHRGFDSNYVSFICKIDRSSQMVNGFFVKVDPTRGIKTASKKSHIFNPTVIKMHHMETVRKNLHLKYVSTARAIFKRERTSELIDCIRSVNSDSKSFSFNGIIFPKAGKGNLTHCDNIFKIPYEEWIK